MVANRLAQSLVKRTTFSSASINVNEVVSPHLESLVGGRDHHGKEIKNVNDHIRPYNEIPGPKGLPFIGNSWRFAPLIGKCH